jgi:hypothetical protein
MSVDIPHRKSLRITRLPSIPSRGIPDTGLGEEGHPAIISNKGARTKVYEYRQYKSSPRRLDDGQIKISGGPLTSHRH